MGLGTHLEPWHAYWREHCLPELSVAGYLRLQKLFELRGERRNWFGGSRCNVKEKLFSSSSEFEFLYGYTGFGDNFYGFGVARIGEKGGAKRMEDSSRRVVSKSSAARVTRQKFF